MVMESSYSLYRLAFDWERVNDSARAQIENCGGFWTLPRPRRIIKTGRALFIGAAKAKRLFRKIRGGGKRECLAARVGILSTCNQ